MRLSYHEYQHIRRSLRNLVDIGNLPYPRGVLHSILQQKKVDNVKRKYHVFAEKVGGIVEFWKENDKFPRWLTLPPVLKVRFLLKGLGLSVKSINRVLRDPKCVESYLDGELAERVEKVVRSAVERDFVYSPLAARLQRSRGKLGENILKEELEKMGIEYMSEKDLRGVFSKTPDFYFEKPVEFNGREVKWIESKALFGDPRTHEIYERKQYSKYREMFGEGVVVYWLGCVEGIEAFDEDKFKNARKYALLDMRIYIAHKREEEFAEKLDAIFVDVSGFEGESIAVAEKILSAYAEGRVVTNCGIKVARLLRNMGFEIIHL